MNIKGGKSFVVRWLAVLLALKYPGCQILILRKTFPELYKNHVKPLQAILNSYSPDKKQRIAEYKGDTKEFKFPNRSTIILGTHENDKEVGKHQGQSYDVIFFEECTFMTEAHYNDIKQTSRLSGFIPVEYKFKPRQYFTGNPGNVGHVWVKKMFIDNPEVNQEGSEYAFIPALVFDNDFLMENDPEYVKELERLPEKLRKAMLYGDWNVFQGQFFEEWDEEKHVIKPFPIPSNWKIYRSRDYGFDMLAGYWIAIDPKGNGYVFREIYQPELIASKAGELLNKNTYEKIYLDIAPPDLWNRQKDSGKSPADIFQQECGHNLTKADNNRANGWLMMREWLADVEEEIVDENGNKQIIKHPKLRFFNTCVNAIRTIPLLVHDENNPGDCLTEPHEITHAPDAIRYFCSSWTFAPNYIPNQPNESWIEKAIRKQNNMNLKGEYMVW